MFLKVCIIIIVITKMRIVKNTKYNTVSLSVSKEVSVFR